MISHSYTGCLVHIIYMISTWGIKIIVQVNNGDKIGQHPNARLGKRDTPVITEKRKGKSIYMVRKGKYPCYNRKGEG